MFLYIRTANVQAGLCFAKAEQTSDYTFICVLATQIFLVQLHIFIYAS